MQGYKGAFLFILITNLTILLLASCGTDSGGGDDKVQINPNIVEVKNCCIEGETQGNLAWAFWRNDFIISGNAFRRFKINESIEVIDEEIFRLNDRQLGGVLTGVNNSSTKIAYIESLISGASAGALIELDLTNLTKSYIRDSTYNISSAVYWHGDDTKLVFYSYGNDQGLQAGYYLHDKIAGADSLLLAHRSPIGPGEMLNGFDLSPDNKKLLIPDVRTTPTSYQPPQIVEYDLATQQADTLEVEFDVFFVKIGLWLRYSPSGDRILYSQFPQGSFGVITNDWSEMGIIELPSLNKRILDANTYEGGHSVQIAPTWSPYGQHIVYGSGPVFFPEGGKGKFSLYVLKNVDDPQNYQ